MGTTLTRPDGLVVVVLGAELTIARDGSSRTETWSTELALAERLLALGFRPENLSPLRMSH